MSYELIHGDCLVEMTKIADGSIDAIICDLPYGTTKCAWDTVIPFALLWEQYKRIIKPRGAIVLFGSQPFTSALIMSNIQWFKYEIIWDKVNRCTGFLDAKNRPLKRHENITFFSNGETKYNPQMGRGIPYKAKRSGEHSKVYGHFNAIDGTNTGDRYPVSILEIKSDTKIENGLHPSQKPVALLEYLIRTYTNEGETILDNCMGSGTTIVAALQTKRNAIGIEMDSAYFAIAERRIADAARAASGQSKQITGHTSDTEGLPIFALEATA